MLEIQEELLVQGFSAFAGAFFAYLFTRIASFFSKVYERQVKHFNSLVRLGNQLNEMGGLIDDNLFILPKFREVLLSGNVYYNNLMSIPLDKTHFDDLHDLDLINLLSDYQHEVRRNNDDIRTFTQGHQMLTQALMSKGMTHPEYKVNAVLLAEQLKTMEAFHSKLLEKTFQLLSRVRVQLDADIPLGTRLQRLFVKTAGDQKKITKEMVKSERKKLEKELKQSRTSSKKEIDRVLRENNLL